MIYVKDLPSMATFYAQAIGLTADEATRSAAYVEFDTGATRLSLHAIPAHIAKEIEITAPPVPREDDPVKLSFEVDDVEAECRRLQALGATIIQRPWGSYDAVDPEGNIFEISARP